MPMSSSDSFRDCNTGVFRNEASRLLAPCPSSIVLAVTLAPSSYFFSFLCIKGL
jgi:hypothetical protein